MDGDWLTYFYTDDSNKIQGPFRASLILQWFQADQFRDDIEMHLTDNGMLVGNEISFTATIGRLKTLFGDTIPTSVKEFKLRWGHSRLNVKQEIASPVPSPSLKAELNDSVWMSDEHDTPSPRRNQMAGPELPPGWNKEVKTEVIGKTRTKSTSSLGSASPYARNGAVRPPSSRKKSEADDYLPFYTGSSVPGKTILQKAVALELASVLQNMYTKMDKTTRENLHLKFLSTTLPDVCKTCNCELKMPSNFLSHVLSQKHITKSLYTNHLEFTLEDDYLPLKRLFSLPERTASVSSTSSSVQGQPTKSRSSSTSSKKRNHNKRQQQCTHQ